MVSVIVPVFNVEKYLDDCIQSIVTQTYSNLEVILVNDGSTDESPLMCENWKKKDSRISVIHKQNGGLSSARNAGLDIAKGEYIIFVDSDDIIARDMVESLFNILDSNSDIDLSVCGIETFNDEDFSYRRPFMSIKSGIYSNTEFITKILSKKVDNAAWNKMYRSEMISSLRFKEGIINEDFPFISYLLSLCNRIEYTSKPLYFYRMRRGSITKSGINKRCWDYVKNAIAFKDNIANKFVGLENDVVDSYISAEIIGQLCTLIKHNGENEYKLEYDESRAYVEYKMKSILRARHLKLKYKVKAIISISCPFLLKL